MKTTKGYIRFLAIGSMLLASILACSLPPIIVPTLVPTVPAARDIYVTTTGRDGPGCGPTTNPCLTVSMAVRRAQAGSTIHIGAGTFLERSFIVLAIPLTFVGASRTTTILSSSGSAVFELAAGVDVHLRDLEVANVRGASSNAIQVDGRSASLEMLRVNVQNNANVGLFVSTGGLATVDSSLFANNVTGIETQGGLQLSGSDFRGNTLNAILSSGVTSIQGSTLEQNGNSTGPGSGSAVVVNVKGGDTDAATMDISQTTLSNNPGFGILNEGGRLSVSNSSVLSSLGGMMNFSGVLNVENSVIADNRESGISVGNRDATAPTVTQLSRVAIVRNALIGLYVQNATVLAKNITVSGHTLAGIRMEPGGSLTLTFSTVADNSGAGIDFEQPTGGQVALSDSLVNLNAAGRDCTDMTRIALSGTFYACNPAVNPRLHLGPLTNEAGTWDLPLQAGSEVIDSHTVSPCPAVDQRGYSRPVDGNGDGVAACDPGSYEFGAGLHETIATPGGPTETPGVIEILPTDTPAVILTGTPTAGVIPTVTFVQNGNCRKGPGLAYNIVTSFATGAQVPALGRNDQNTWVYLSIPNTTAFCWVGVASVTVNVPVETLALVPTPPLPDAPGKFNDKADCEIKLKTLTVQLSWADVANASGYHLYRNGTLLASLDASVSTYLDKTAPLGHDLLYELESFNADGSSARVQTTVSACK